MASIGSEVGLASFAPSGGRKLGVLRLAVTGGVSAAIIFILCWVGTFIPFASPTHAYIALFTPAEMSSVQALAEGTLWSLLFGGFSGLVLALIYNLFAGLDRHRAV